MPTDVHSAIRALQAICAAALLALALLPVRLVAAGPNVCLVRRLFGVPCFGCGMTRAISQLLHGHWQAGLSYNRGAAVVLFALMSIAVSAVVVPRSKD